MTMTYAEKLKDPRWQRKRLEILQRDDFTCQNCLATDKTLHIHHGYYRRGLEPWEYDGTTLWTLCEDCHEETAASLADIHELIGSVRPSDHPHLLDLIWHLVHVYHGSMLGTEKGKLLVELWQLTRQYAANS